MESKFRHEVSKFGKKDGILAICVVLGYVLFSIVGVTVRDMIPSSFLMDTISLLVMTLLPAAVVIAIVVRKKQGIASIGLHTNKLLPAIGLGLLFGLIPIVFIAVLQGFFGGFNEIQIGGLLLGLISTILFATHEDVVYVGFMQTRLYGLFKTDRAAIAVGGALFSLMHVPPWLIMGRIDLSNEAGIRMFAFNLIAWFLMHVIFISIFKKYYSLVPVFILHTLNNFAYSFSWYDGVTFVMLAMVTMAVVAGLLFYHMHKKEKNQNNEDYNDGIV